MWGEISVTICKIGGGYKMQESARWDLNRLYLNEDILFPILELKEQYFVTKDVEILSKLIQAIEKQNTICTVDRLKKVFHLTLLN